MLKKVKIYESLNLSFDLYKESNYINFNHEKSGIFGYKLDEETVQQLKPFYELNLKNLKNRLKDLEKEIEENLKIEEKIEKISKILLNETNKLNLILGFSDDSFKIYNEDKSVNNFDKISVILNDNNLKNTQKEFFNKNYILVEII
jgi:hypothetical protein